MQNRVFVLFSDESEAMPCHPARARQLLDTGKAAVYRHEPFTIILTEREDGDTQPTECKVDPGSKTTGLALVASFKRGKRLIWAANLSHRGHEITEKLRKRRSHRRARRSRKTRYRKQRSENRNRPEGWLSPSIRSRVDNITEWARRLAGRAPVTSIVCETDRFDTQKMQRPEIKGKEYQQGTLEGYDMREYLLYKFDHTCVYCGATEVPLEIDHVQPKSKGGSDRVSNLVTACVSCNREKGAKPIEDFVSGERLKRVQSRRKESLRDAGVMNAMRRRIGEALSSQTELPTTFSTGSRTKYNRTEQGYAKDHWTDAACAGETGGKVYIPKGYRPLSIKAEGRGSRQMCSMDRFGFPRTSAKEHKRVDGFQTGDLVRAVVPSRYKTGGTHTGKVSVRSSGSFAVTGSERTDGINSKHCRLLQRVDGYSYVQL